LPDNLPRTFPTHPEVPPDFFQGQGYSTPKAETQDNRLSSPPMNAGQGLGDKIASNQLRFMGGDGIL
jgi:hypothetical protein